MESLAEEAVEEVVVRLAELGSVELVVDWASEAVEVVAERYESEDVEELELVADDELEELVGKASDVELTQSQRLPIL